MDDLEAIELLLFRFSLKLTKMEILKKERSRQ